MKLVIPEPETDALQAELARWREKVTSSLALTEVLRACRIPAAAGVASAVIEALVARGRAVLEGVAMLDLETPLLKQAGLVDPVGLRSLDAIHLATALSVAQELGALITYDGRLAAAAKGQGLEVLSPS